MHTCPDCGCACHCGGDIDDIDFGDDCEGADACTHYQTDDCHSSEADLFHDEPSSSDINSCRE